MTRLVFAVYAAYVAAAVPVVVAPLAVAVVIAVVFAVVAAILIDDDFCFLAGLSVFAVLVGLAVLGFLGFLRALGHVVGLLGAALLGFLGDVVVGVAVGGVVVGGVGFLFFLVVSIVVEVGARRAVQVPAHLRTVPALAPKTLRWVRGLLPGDEGAAWLAEVTSCLAEATDKGERRRYMRSYRRKVPQLIWTSWSEHLSASRQRELL